MYRRSNEFYVKTEAVSPCSDSYLLFKLCSMPINTSFWANLSHFV